MSQKPCHACGGSRLKPEALAVKIDGLHIGAGLRDVDQNGRRVVRRPARPADRQAERDRRAHPQGDPGASRLPQRCRPRIPHSLAPSGTLSGGESQRIRLASQIGSGLTGVLYVLDEPSIGLHQRDNARLLETLRHLRDLGNTVIVVEHDEDAIRTADYVIDIGPAAGVHGGEIVAEGTPDEIMATPESLTGQYLTGFRQIPLPADRRAAVPRPSHPRRRRHGEQPEERHRRNSAGHLHLPSRASPAAASRRSSSTRSTRPSPAG